MGEHGGLRCGQGAARERVQEQAQRMQRLAQVVAGGGQKAGLVLVGLLGALRLSAQLHDKAFVVELGLYAAARGLREVARMYAGQCEIHAQHGAGGQGDGAAVDRQRHDQAADHDGEVDHETAQHRRAQPQRARGNGAQDAGGIDHALGAASIAPHYPAQRAPGQPHRGHACHHAPSVAARGHADARQWPQDQVDQRHRGDVRCQPPEHGRLRQYQRHDPGRAHSGEKRGAESGRKTPPQQRNLLGQHLVAVPAQSIAPSIEGMGQVNGRHRRTAAVPAPGAGRAAAPRCGCPRRAARRWRRHARVRCSRSGPGRVR